MKKGIRQAVAILLVLAMTTACAFAAVQDTFDDRDKGKRGRWSAVDEGEVFVIFEKYEITMEQGTKTNLAGTVIGADMNADYYWKSSKEDIVRVTGYGKDGTLEAVGQGTARIKLTVINPDGSYDYDYANITVKGAVTPMSVSGGTRVDMKAGESINLAASISGGSGSYSYQWDSYGSVSITDSMRQNASVYAGMPGAGTVTLTVYDGENPANNASTTWTFQVTSAATAPTGRLDKTSLSLAPGETTTLTLTAAGGTGSYEYYWESDYAGVVDISGSGSTVMVTASSALMPGVNTAQIRAAVVDTRTGLRSDVLTCIVTVQSASASFNVSTRAAMNTSMSMNDIAGMIADAFRNQLGRTLSYTASVRLGNPSNRIGVLRLQDNTTVSSYTSYSYGTMQDMIFYPLASGTFSTDYSISDAGLMITGTITIEVVGGISVQSATLDKTQLNMETYSSQFLNLTVLPRTASYSVTWTSSNNRVAQVYGEGSSVTVQSGGVAGKADITAVVKDLNGNEYRCVCNVVVNDHGKTDTYNPTLTVTMGSDYYGTSISDSIANRFRSTFGVVLGNDALIRFPSMGSSIYGTLRLYDGTAVRANQNYTFLDLIYMYFEANAAGTYTLPYELSYQSYTMSGTISVFIKASSFAVTITPADMVLSPYSSQPITVSVSPANIYYRVNWISSDTNVVTVKGSGNTVTVQSANKTGVITVTAVVIDASGAEIRRNCTVQVINKSNAYDPSVSTTLGVPYTGTGTSSAMRSQFYDLYNVRLDDKAATITFASTGNNDVGILRLQDGTPIKANTAYTFEQYVKMYTQPVATGQFNIPYTLSYNGRTLTGTVSVVIMASEINVTLKLESGNPYLFSDNLAGGSGSTVLSDAIRNSVGSAWGFLRFSKFSDNTGTLYQDKNSTALKTTTDVKPSALSNLYFKPGNVTGTFTAQFTVYNANGGILCTGKLNIVKQDVSFSDVPASAYYASAVSWAVGKGITSGTGGSLFSPDMKVSRSQAVTFLWRAAGQPKPTMSENPFKDVKEGDYYYEAVLWAVQQGITQGTSANTFSPLDTLNRDQLLTFLCRANGGYAAGSDWSKLAVDWANGRGLLEGIPGTFVAGAPCPRSEVVYYLWKNYVG